MNPKTRKWIAVLSLSLCLVASCLEAIKLDLAENRAPRNLLVDGLISNLNEPDIIRLSYTSPVGVRGTEPASGAEVHVRDDLGREERLQEMESGAYYLMKEVVKGEIGRSYELEVRIGESLYRSRPEKMFPVSRIDSIYFEVVFDERVNDQGRLEFKNFFDVYVDVDLLPDKSARYMRWETVNWYQFTEPPCPNDPFWIPKSCYIRTPPNPRTVLLFDGERVEGNRWERQRVASKIVDWSFYERNYFNIFQYSLSQEAYNYWAKVDRVINQTGSIFDSPPAAVIGNVSRVDEGGEIVLGYFGASAVDRIRQPVFRQDLGMFLRPFCDRPYFFYFSEPNSPCANCLNLKNSTADRPSFW